LTTAEVSPPIPEVRARYFADIVRFTAIKAHQRWNRVFELADLEQEAWVIANERWQHWSDQKAYARNDLKFALDRWVNKRLPELGWKYLRQSDGRRRWVPTQTTLPYDPTITTIDGYSTPWDSTPWDSTPEDTEGSLSDWTPMGRSKREQFASILFDQYPVLVLEFEAVANLVKPAKTAHAVWKRQQERDRAKLRVKYATELATARYAVEGFTEDIAA
jgi:hypothetical protein